MSPGYFCSKPHPEFLEEAEEIGADGRKHPVQRPYVFCRLRKGHPGDHAAYTFSVKEPTLWAN